jgi:probable rRNA maturation factor
MNALLKDIEACEMPQWSLEVEVVLIGDREMKLLNTKYRGKPKTTDVLSFPMWRDEGRTRYLGQVFISLPAAHKQARELRHSYLEEIAFLFTHGTLHLLGWDQVTRPKDLAMKVRSYEIIDRVMKPN